MPRGCYFRLKARKTTVEENKMCFLKLNVVQFLWLLQSSCKFKCRFAWCSYFLLSSPFLTGTFPFICLPVTPSQALNCSLVHSPEPNHLLEGGFQIVFMVSIARNTSHTCYLHKYTYHLKTKVALCYFIFPFPSFILSQSHELIFLAC